VTLRFSMRARTWGKVRVKVRMRVRVRARVWVRERG
jgi:hypothetical protein